MRWFTNPILLEFALGIVAYVLWKSGLLMRRRWAWAVAGVIGGAVLVPQALSGTIPMAKMEFIVDNSLSLQRVMMWGLPMFFIFLSVLAFDRVRSGRLSYLSAKLGDASYSLYLAHIPAILGLTVVLGLVPFTIAPDAVFILCIAVGLLAGFLYYRHVERPMKTYLEHRAASLLLGDGRMARRPVQR